ncbi:MAG TPA: tetratricopeptide repeat protein [Thermoanaerobaculia bacterium]|nr:tetratricopeptide repeat protein [Thermoanaerobaculia bacterium]
MNKLIGAAVLVAAIGAPGFILGEKKPQEPFYRRYLVAGNPLDDKILAQEKRVEADPKSADLRNDFGNLLAARRFPKEAREQYETAIKLDPHNFLAPYNLGILYETMGENGKAITAYEKSVDRNRGFPPSRFRLGRLYEKRGSNQSAIEQYARALQIDPGMRDPKRNPLIVDTSLMAFVSLENYPRDMATASMISDANYSDPSLVRRLPVDRTLSSEDLQPAPAGTPAAAAAPPTTPVKVISSPPNPPRREPVRPAPRQPPNVAEPAPDAVVLPPEPTDAPTTEPPTPPPYPRGAPPPPPTPVPD